MYINLSIKSRFVIITDALYSTLRDQYTCFFSAYYLLTSKKCQKDSYRFFHAPNVEVISLFTGINLQGNHKLGTALHTHSNTTCWGEWLSLWLLLIVCVSLCICVIMFVYHCVCLCVCVCVIVHVSLCVSVFHCVSLFVSVC